MENNIQEIRESRASQFLQMVSLMNVIVYQEQLVQDKGHFIRSSLDTILEGHVDHISDVHDLFLVLVRYYLEHTTKIAII